MDITSFDSSDNSTIVTSSFVESVKNAFQLIDVNHTTTTYKHCAETLSQSQNHHLNNQLHTEDKQECLSMVYEDNSHSLLDMIPCYKVPDLPLDLRTRNNTRVRNSYIPGVATLVYPLANIEAPLDLQRETKNQSNILIKQEPCPDTRRISTSSVDDLQVHSNDTNVAALTIKEEPTSANSTLAYSSYSEDSNHSIYEADISDDETRLPQQKIIRRNSPNEDRVLQPEYEWNVKSKASNYGSPSLKLKFIKVSSKSHLEAPNYRNLNRFTPRPSYTPEKHRFYCDSNVRIVVGCDDSPVSNKSPNPSTPVYRPACVSCPSTPEITPTFSTSPMIQQKRTTTQYKSSTPILPEPRRLITNNHDNSKFRNRLKFTDVSDSVLNLGFSRIDENKAQRQSSSDDTKRGQMLLVADELLKKQLSRTQQVLSLSRNKNSFASKRTRTELPSVSENKPNKPRPSSKTSTNSKKSKKSTLDSIASMIKRKVLCAASNNISVLSSSNASFPGLKQQTQSGKSSSGRSNQYSAMPFCVVKNNTTSFTMPPPHTPELSHDYEDVSRRNKDVFVTTQPYIPSSHSQGMKIEHNLTGCTESPLPLQLRQQSRLYDASSMHNVSAVRKSNENSQTTASLSQMSSELSDDDCSTFLLTGWQRSEEVMLQKPLEPTRRVCQRSSIKKLETHCGNGHSNTRKQYLDLKHIEDIGMETCELIAAFVSDEDLHSYSRQFKTSIERVVLEFLCSRCGINVSEHMLDHSVMKLSKTSETKQPTDRDVRRLLRHYVRRM